MYAGAKDQGGCHSDHQRRRRLHGIYVIYAPDDTVTAISIFNNCEGAEESNKRVLAWIEESLAPLLVGSATATAGPVIGHTLA